MRPPLLPPRSLSADDNSWEPKENLSCKELVDKFEATQRKKRAAAKASKTTKEDEIDDDAESMSAATKKAKSTPAKAKKEMDGFGAVPSKGGVNRKVAKVTGCQRKSGAYGYLVTW